MLNFYMREVVARSGHPQNALNCIAPLLRLFAGRTLADLGPKASREYTDRRCAETGRHGRPISRGTAHRDLAVLRAAINVYDEEHRLSTVPKIKLPGQGEARQSWLTRACAARLLWAAWRNPEAKHLARVILIGLYTGTRSGAILKLRWLPSTQGGWFDLDRGLLYRRGIGQRQTKKLQPPAPIHIRLMPHLRRWHRLDTRGAPALTHVIHFRGEAVTKLRRSWRTACRTAGLAPEMVVHSLRHTAATWLMQAGVDRWEAGGYLGMSVETLETVYGHHHPDFQATAAQATAPKKRPGKGVQKRAKAGISGDLSA